MLCCVVCGVSSIDAPEKKFAFSRMNKTRTHSSDPNLPKVEVLSLNFICITPSDGVMQIIRTESVLIILVNSGREVVR